MLKKQKGFTIVELLIVIVVIAILAAISVVAYAGIQERARIATMKSDLRSIGTAMQMYKAEHGALPNSFAETVRALDAAKMRELGAGQYNANKRFVYCYGTNGSNIWIAAADQSESWAASTKPVQYFSATTGVTEGTFNQSHSDTYLWQRLCRSISSDYTGRGEWSYNILNLSGIN